MPLYEFTCDSCGLAQELLLHSEQKPVCESCGSEKMTKELSLPIAHSPSSGPDSPPPAGPCGSGCGCFPH